MSVTSEESVVTGDPGRATGQADIVVKGRNVEIPDHFRIFVRDKLSRLERYDKTIYLFDVELEHERNRRQKKACQRVEITARGKGPVVRGEACADTFYSAVEAAVAKVESRLRRARDRRKVHYGDKTPLSVSQATKELVTDSADLFALDGDRAHVHNGAAVDTDTQESHGPGQIVRTKEHPAKPMSVDDALYEMELVGHDFFLFHDEASGQPSVVYRRHGYDYGLIRLTD